MDVLMIFHGYPGEMPYFTRALFQAGARVVGVSDRPIDEVPDVARQHLTHYLHRRPDSLALADESQKS